MNAELDDRDNPYAPPLSGPIIDAEVTPGGRFLQSGDAWYVDYEFTLEDSVQFNLDHLAKSPWARMQVWKGAGAFFVCALFAVFLLVSGCRIAPDYTSIILLNGIPIIAIIGFYAVTYPWRYHGMVRRNTIALLRESQDPFTYGPCRIVISPDWLVDSNATSEMRYRWVRITRILRGPSHAYLYFASANAVIVPRRAFRDDAEYEKFLAIVEGFCQQAKKSAG